MQVSSQQNSSTYFIDYSESGHALTIRVNDPMTGWEPRPINDLVLIRGDKGYSWLQWRDGRQYVKAYPLKHYEAKFTCSTFLRVHQNCLVNQDFIRRVQLTRKGPQLTLITGDKIIISRRRWIALKRQLIQLSNERLGWAS